jgi:hypothetical protein
VNEYEKIKAEQQQQQRQKTSTTDRLTSSQSEYTGMTSSRDGAPIALDMDSSAPLTPVTNRRLSERASDSAGTPVEMQIPMVRLGIESLNIV